MKVYRMISGTMSVADDIPEIKEATYTGKYMGERKIVATIKHETIIPFQIGDFVVLDLWNLDSYDSKLIHENFYIYTEPVIKKTSSAGSVGDAFEHTVTFYPAQYELQHTIMRDVFVNNVTTILYTGFSNFSFYGGAKMLLNRIVGCMSQIFQDDEGNGLWKYELEDSINEDINTALEHFQFDFNNNSVWDAVLMLCAEDKINTNFFIVNRTIFVGYREPIINQVGKNNEITTIPFTFEYGKTSHLLSSNFHLYQQKGGLMNITKTNGNNKPITRLYAYGTSRNLNRFYCSDRLKKGRYVNKLMLPSFERDGLTDYIDDEVGKQRYGIREGIKEFSEIFPSIKNITYGTLRKIKYMIRLEANDYASYTTHIPLVRCYKIETDETDNRFTKLTPSYPPTTLAIFIHATGKVIRCLLKTNAQDQEQQDRMIPKDGDDQPIVGACFAAEIKSDESLGHWEYLLGIIETDLTRVTTTIVNGISVTAAVPWKTDKYKHIDYTDDFWLTDIYEYVSDDQTTFITEGYSAYCYPRITKDYFKSDENTIAIDTIVDAQDVVIEDTDARIDAGKTEQQTTFSIYCRDFGFVPDLQIYEGHPYYLIPGSTFKVEFFTGYMAGYSFEVAQQSGIVDTEYQERSVCIIPAYVKKDGAWVENQKFYEFEYIGHLSKDSELYQQAVRKAKDAIYNGAFWRLELIRNEFDYGGEKITNCYVPMIGLNAIAGDRFVLTDIYMPDVYIRAAEEKLETEAYNYLQDITLDDITYNFEFDKIRLAQQQNLALQIREGAVMRIKDESLNIKESGYLKELLVKEFSQSLGYYDYNEETLEYEKYVDTRQIQTVGYITINKSIVGDDLTLLADNQLKFVRVDNDYEILIKCTDINYVGENCVFEYGVHFEQMVKYHIYLRYAKADIVTFPIYIDKQIRLKKNRYYNIKIEIEADIKVDTKSLILYKDNYNSKKIYKPIIDNLTISNKSRYPKSYKVYEYKFYLPYSFYDNDSYLFGLTINDITMVTTFNVILSSITESNIDYNNKVIDYTEQIIDNATIKISTLQNANNGENSRASKRGTDLIDKSIYVRDINVSVKTKRKGNKSGK